MKCLGKYQNTNKEIEIIHFPFGVEEDFTIKKPEYYLTQQCEEHEECTTTSVRGIPLHGKSLNVKTMIFSNDEIVDCSNPLFYAYEQPPSSSEKQYDFDGTFELLEMINTEVSLPSKRKFEE